MEHKIIWPSFWCPGAQGIALRKEDGPLTCGTRGDIIMAAHLCSSLASSHCTSNLLVIWKHLVKKEAVIFRLEDSQHAGDWRHYNAVGLSHKARSCYIRTPLHANVDSIIVTAIIILNNNYLLVTSIIIIIIIIIIYLLICRYIDYNIRFAFNLIYIFNNIIKLEKLKYVFLLGNIILYFIKKIECTYYIQNF